MKKETYKYTLIVVEVFFFLQQRSRAPGHERDKNVEGALEVINKRNSLRWSTLFQVDTRGEFMGSISQLLVKAMRGRVHLGIVKSFIELWLSRFSCINMHRI